MEEQAQMSFLPKEQIDEKQDMLKQIFELQKALARRMFNIDTLTEQEKEYWSVQMYLALTKEAGEVIDWHNWKHWKKTKKKINITEIKYELVDCMHFLVEWMLIFDMTPEEMTQLYVTKNKENHNRQERSY